VVPAWSYQWLVATPDVAGSWVLPLDVQRRGPTAKSATEVALEQIAAVRRAQAADAPRPVVTLDSGYDLETLALSTVDADLLVRLTKHRVVLAAADDSTGSPGVRRSHHRCVDQPPRGWCTRRAFQCGARQGRASAQQEAATPALVAGLDRRSATR